MELMELTLPHTNLSTNSTGLLLPVSSMVVSPLHTAMVEAHYQDKTQIKDIPNEELLFFCGKVISNALAKLNHKNTYDDEGRAVAITILAQDLRLYRPFFTKQEIVMAVNMGCNGEFSKPDAIITFSPSMVMRWTAAYGEKRNEALALAKKEEEKLAKIAQEERMRGAEKIYLNQQWARLCEYVEAFQEFPTDEKVSSLFRTFHNRLTDIGYILPADVCWDILTYFRNEVITNILPLEMVVYGNHMKILRDNIENRQRIFTNNYFDTKALGKAREKFFQLQFWWIMKQYPQALREIEF